MTPAAAGEGFSGSSQVVLQCSEFDLHRAHEIGTPLHACPLDALDEVAELELDTERMILEAWIGHVCAVPRVRCGDAG